MNQTIKQPWWQLLSIQTGGTICLPVIMVGHLVCQKFGWLAALLSVAFGNLFLLIIGYLLAHLSTHRPQSTAQHAAHSFGNQGRILFASLMMLAMLGWFGIQLNVMSLSFGELLRLLGMDIPYLFLNIGIGVMISCVMCLGMKAIKGLSYCTVPLLGLTLLYTTFFSEGSLPTASPLTFSWIHGLSIIIGANIAAVIDLPTFFRHAKSPKDAKVCILLLYGIVVPLIEGVGIYLSSVTGGDSILDVLQMGHGPLWAIWISCFVFLSGWATNNTNLYSSITSSYSIVGKCTPRIRTWALGILGTCIATLNPLGNIENVLDFLGITIGGMGAVILANYLLEKNIQLYKTSPRLSLLSWAIGVGIGIYSSLFPKLTSGVPALDAFLIAFALQIILYPIFQKKKDYETANSR